MRLSAASEKQLIGVHPALVKVVRRAVELCTAQGLDFRVMEGLRSLTQQKKNVAKGVSKTLKSKHLTGHAVDLIPMIGGKVTWSWPPYHRMAPVIKQAARDVGVTVTWGGDWKSFKDGPHWEVNPAKYKF